MIKSIVKFSNFFGNRLHVMSNTAIKKKKKINEKMLLLNRLLQDTVALILRSAIAFIYGFKNTDTYCYSQKKLKVTSK